MHFSVTFLFLDFDVGFRISSIGDKSVADIHDDALLYLETELDKHDSLATLHLCSFGSKIGLLYALPTLEVF